MEAAAAEIGLSLKELIDDIDDASRMSNETKSIIGAIPYVYCDSGKNFNPITGTCVTQCPTGLEAKNNVCDVDLALKCGSGTLWSEDIQKCVNLSYKGVYRCKLPNCPDDLLHIAGLIIGDDKQYDLRKGLGVIHGQFNEDTCSSIPCNLTGFDRSVFTYDGQHIKYENGTIALERVP